jgi:PIN domain nuclease of toxin-antitoxin system
VSYLLDTHVLLAVLDDRSDPLAAEAKRALHDDQARVAVSVASLWEIAIKWRLGKLPLPARLDRLPEVVTNIGFETIAIGSAHVVAAVDPDPPTRDPFDRLLLAQCKVEGLKLLTTDRALASHPLAVRLA